MNLHDIHHAMPNIALIAEYCEAYYHMYFRVADGGRWVQYSTTEAREHWSDLSERDTLTYTNQALRWAEDGRPSLVRE